MTDPARKQAVTLACLAVFALSWTASVVYLSATGSSLVKALLSMAVVGLALPGLATLLTRKAAPPPIPVERPARELVFVLGYLIVYAFYFLGWALGAVRAASAPGVEQDVALVILKLGVGVSAPAVLLYLLQAQLAPLFDPGLRRKGVWPTLAIVGGVLAALTIFASGSHEVTRAQVLPPSVLLWAAPVAFAWVALDALSEAFLYQAVVQSRLAAVLENQVAAVAISALLFSLAHVPGIFLRGSSTTLGYSTDLSQVVAYCIAVMGPIGLLYGTLWARTRSLVLVVVAHACLSFAPRIPEVVATLG